MFVFHCIQLNRAIGYAPIDYLICIPHMHAYIILQFVQVIT